MGNVGSLKWTFLKQGTSSAGGPLFGCVTGDMFGDECF